MVLGGVQQQGNSLRDGDIVGKDKTVYDHSSHYYGIDGLNQSQPQTHMSRLTQELERQIKDGEIIDGLVDEYLKHYSTKPATDVIGLEEKLTLANWDCMYEQGIEFKEAYHKKLLKTSNYKAAQEIHCLLLKKTATVFLKYIKPVLHEEGLNQVRLTEIIDERLIYPIITELGSNVISLYEDEISGMLYFLTGNCHLNWK